MLTAFAQRKEYSQMLIDLARLSVLPQQPAQNPLSPHPLDLCRHTSLGGTLPFSSSGMPALALGSKEIASAGARVDGCGFDDNRTVLDELLLLKCLWTKSPATRVRISLHDAPLDLGDDAVIARRELNRGHLGNSKSNRLTCRRLSHSNYVE